MIPRKLDIDLEFDTFSVSGTLPLTPLARVFGWLADRNDEARELDADPPHLLIRIQCPACRAPVFQLTTVERDGELLRACRCCRVEFPVGV